MKKKSGFTVGEILITLSIVGTISVLTLGVVNHEVKERVMNNSKIMFNNEVAVAAATMQANQDLAGYKDQTSFDEAFKKYFEANNVADLDTTENFAEKYIDESGKEFTPYEYKDSNGNTIKLKNRAVSSKGVSFAYTYDTNCKPRNAFAQDASSFSDKNGKFNYMAKNEALSCIKGFYDVNGAKGPNKIGQDVAFFAEFKKDCRDQNGNITNYIPDVYGRCPGDAGSRAIPGLSSQGVCSITDQNCKSDGSLKSLDKNSCECLCKISCPKGQKLDKETCTCGCNTEGLLNQIGCKKDAYGNYQSLYADCKASIQYCTPTTKDPRAAEKCKSNHGIWDKDRLTCDCSAANQEYQKAPFFGFAVADEKNFCQAKCVSSKKDSTFINKVKENAKKDMANDSEISGIVNSTTIDSPSNGCFKCVQSANSKIAIQKSAGYCTSQCRDASQAGKYPYFKLSSMGSAGGNCTWVCNNKQLDEYVTKLNKQTTIIPQTSTPEALGKAQELYPLAYEIGANTSSCTECMNIRESFKNEASSKNFAGFLCNINDSAKNTNLCKDLKPFNETNYSIKYTADYSKCAVKLTSNGLNYGPTPHKVISFHCARGKCIRATFTFAGIKNAELGNKKLSNPNKYINVPKSFAEKYTAKTKNHSDAIWDNQIIGIRLGYTDVYDPLALNIGNKQTDYPSSSGAVVRFPFSYNEKTRKYEEVKVLWQNEDKFAFIVNKPNFSKSGGQHVGNMLSDVYSQAAGKKFDSGFAQLREQYDTNNDGLVSRDEFKDKLYIWKRTTNEYTPLTDFVFDLNTWSRSETNSNGSAKQNQGMIYDISGKYRRLIPLDEEPTCGITDICLLYTGTDSEFASNKDALIAEKWKWINSTEEEVSEEASEEEVTELSDEEKEAKVTFHWLPVGKANYDNNKLLPSDYQYTYWYTPNGSHVNQLIARAFKLYYKENDKWYEVKIYNLTDIVFKSTI